MIKRRGAGQAGGDGQQGLSGHGGDQEGPQAANPGAPDGARGREAGKYNYAYIYIYIYIHIYIYIY